MCIYMYIYIYMCRYIYIYICIYIYSWFEHPALVGTRTSVAMSERRANTAPRGATKRPARLQPTR